MSKLINKYLVHFTITIFLYSGLLKWINIGVDLTLISLLLIIVFVFIDLKKMLLSINKSNTNSEIKFLILFGILYTLTFIYTVSNSYFIEKIGYLWIAVLSFLLPIIFLNNENKIFIFIKVFTFLAKLGVLFLLYLLLTSQWSLFITTQEEGTKIPNYLSVGSFLGVFIFLNHKNRKIVDIFFNLLAIGLMFFLSGRGPLLGLVTVFFIFYLLGKNKIKKIRIFIGLVVLGYFFIDLFINSREFLNSQRRLLSLFTETNVRYYQIQQVIEIIGENFFFGVGIGGYGIAADNVDVLWHPHNMILEVLSESGILITLFFLYFLFLIFIRNTIKTKLNNNIFVMISLYLFLEAMKSGGIPDMRITFFWFGFMTLIQKKYSNLKNF